MASQWFYKHNGEKVGPVTAQQLKSLAASKHILPDDLIWKEGMAEWAKAGKVIGLIPERATETPLRQTPPPLRPANDPDPSDPHAAANMPPQFRNGTKASISGTSATIEQVSTTLSAAKRHGAEFVGRFRQIDFKREVWPLDAASARKLASEPAFWAITLLAALPLLFGTIEGPDHQLVAFSVYFAVIWGLIFRFNVVPGVRIGWGLLGGTLLFTGLVGMFLLVGICFSYIFPIWFVNSVQSPDALVRLGGFLFRAGVCEEMCKAIPVVGLMFLFRRKPLGYSDIIMIGVFSGLGFAAFESLDWFKVQASAFFNGIMNDPNANETTLLNTLVADSQFSMLMVLTRTISLTFGHAVWSALFAHFIAQSRGAGAKRLPLLIVGLTVAAGFHGIYDWLSNIQKTGSVLITVLSFMLLKLYIVQGTATQADRQPAAVPEAIPDNGIGAAQAI
jgi:RsiW-degrading membrane proteinase PrsW (M82 family)